MTHKNTRGALSRWIFALLLIVPSPACDCDSELSLEPPASEPGFSLAGILIADPGSGYEVGDDVVFGSSLLAASGSGAAALISGVDVEGGITAVAITEVGHGYLIAPTASVASEGGKGCVLIPDIRIVEICMENEAAMNINGTMLLSVPDLFGATSFVLPISAVCFSELGSDECFLAVNGTLQIAETVELEVTLFTTTLNEFADSNDHIVMAEDEGMILVHKTDLDGDGEYEFAKGEITFHSALGGAIALTAATIDMETDSFASGLTGVFDGSIGVSGAIDFTDCN